MIFRHATKFALVGAIAFTGALIQAPVAAQSVAVTSIVEHPALDSVKDGVLEALNAAGHTEDKGLKWQFQTAQGNTAIAAQIARKFVGDNPDFIVAIATLSARPWLLLPVRFRLSFRPCRPGRCAACAKPSPVAQRNRYPMPCRWSGRSS